MGRLSGMAAGRRRYTPACSARFARGGGDGARRSSKAQRGPMVRQLAATPRRARSPPIHELLRLRARAGRRRRSRTTARSATAPGGGGAKGYPNLNDDDWLWGGKLDDIHAHDPPRHPLRPTTRTRASADMPAFGRTDAEAGRRSRRRRLSCARCRAAGAAERRPRRAARQVFADNCAACHGDEGKGNRELGAPNLTDAIWLYGGDKADDRRRISAVAAASCRPGAGGSTTRRSRS